MINLLNHIAIIPDGNRRWARKKGMARFLGHKSGAEITENILKTAFDLGVSYVTLWGASVNNITKRPKIEVNYLLNVFEKYFLKLAESPEVHKRKIKVNALGKWEELFPVKVKKAIQKAIEATKNYKGKELTILLAYSGIDEMTEAIKQIALQPASSKLQRGEQAQDKQSAKTKIDANLVKKYLWTKDLPPVDLVIRTGGDPHWSSGFMMWHTTDSQFYFTKTLWPDFNEKELKKAITEYAKRERRLGE